MTQINSGYRIKRMNYTGTCELCRQVKPPEKVSWMPDYPFNGTSGHQKVREEMQTRQYGWLCVDCFVKIQMKL
jgi:hypothetical protein